MTENQFDDIELSAAGVDPEADEIVDDALDIDSAAEAIAADEATHDEAEVTAEHDGGRAIRDVVHGCIVDGHLLTLVFSQSAFFATQH